MHRGRQQVTGRKPNRLLPAWLLTVTTWLLLRTTVWKQRKQTLTVLRFFQKEQTLTQMTLCSRTSWTGNGNIRTVRRSFSHCMTHGYFRALSGTKCLWCLGYLLTTLPCRLRWLNSYLKTMCARLPCLSSVRIK